MVLESICGVNGRELNPKHGRSVLLCPGTQLEQALTATVLALPWGKLQQEQAAHSAAPQERRFFAQDAAASLVIYLHFPEAKVRLVALPLGSAIAMACEGHAITWNNLIFFLTSLLHIMILCQILCPSRMAQCRDRNVCNELHYLLHHLQISRCPSL